jgi:peroxiredoxin/outer membrane lipoprotein-sorting protein
MMRLRLIVLAFAYLSTVPTRGDEQADTILEKAAAKARATQTLSAEIEMSWQTPGQPLKRSIGSVKLMKPNYARINLRGDFPLHVLASDGTTVYAMPDASTYKEALADERGANIDEPWWGLPFRYFFTQSANPFGPLPDTAAKATYIGEEVSQGEKLRVVEVSAEKPMVYRTRLYFNQQYILLRTIVKFGGPDGAFFEAAMSNLTTGPPLTLAEFHFVPPITATLKESAEAKMLAIGEKGPEFSLRTFDDRTISLSTVQRGKKAILINFWYLACPPCREEFPIFEQLYGALKDKGLAIVAVNHNDSAKEVAEYVKKTGLTFTIAMGDDGESSVFIKYSVNSTFPATYLLDEQGQIVYRAAGIDEAGLRKALEKLGLN